MDAPYVFDGYGWSVGWLNDDEDYDNGWLGWVLNLNLD